MKTNSLQIILASWLLSLSLTTVVLADTTTQEIIVDETLLAPSSDPVSENYLFDGFNVPGGTLIGVSFSWDLNSSNTNVSTELCLMFGDCAPGQAEFSIFGSDPAFTPLFDSVVSAEYGFTDNTDAIQTHAVENLALMGSIDLLNLNDFIGAGNIGSTTWDFNQQANGFATLDTLSVNGTLSLTYEFTSDGNVPEPSILFLLGLGLAGIGLTGRWKK